MLVLAPATAHPAAPKKRPGVVSHWEINNIQQDHLPIHIALGCYGSNLVHPKMNQNLVHPESWPVHLWALKRSSALSSARSRKAMARSASAVPSAITGENEIGIGSVGQLCPKFVKNSSVDFDKFCPSESGSLQLLTYLPPCWVWCNWERASHLSTATEW